MSTSYLAGRLRRIFWVVVVALIGVTVAGWLGFRAATGAERRVAGEGLETLLLVERFDSLAERRVSLNRGYLLTGNPAFLAELREARERSDALLARLDAELQNDRERALLAEVRRTDQAHREAVDRAIALRDAGLRERTLESFEGDVQDRLIARDAALARFLASEYGEVGRAISGVESLADNLAVAMLVGALAALAATAYLVRRLALSALRAHDETVEARAVLDAVVEHAPVGIGFWDRDLRFVRLNATLAEINGLPVEAHPGRTVDELLPGVGGPSMAAMRRVLETGEPVTTEIEGETPASPGLTRHWNVRFYPVRRGEETVGVGALCEEITDRVQAERHRERLIGVLGHDLKTPLAAISLGAQRLARRELPAEDRALVDRIRASTARAVRLIGDILDYTRSQQRGGLPLDRGHVSLAAVARQAASEVELGHPGSRVELEGEADVVGHWDPGRLGQLLSNLLGNAAEHGEGGVPIRLRLGRERGRAVVEVANRGPAIPRDKAARLFEPFTRSSAGRARNLGLGLYIAGEIVRAHRGTIDVESADGETIFRVCLPLRIPPGFAAGLAPA